MPVPAIAKMLRNNRLKPVSRLIIRILQIKSNAILGRIKQYIKGKEILDIGTGIGGINYHLRKLGFTVTGLDVHNVSAFTDITPKLYDGENFPFKNNQFDTGIIVHVLHHCEDGVRVLSETMRTCRRVILIEDTYRNWVEHKIVSFNDNLGNWEWYQHPYHQTSWWVKFIKQNGWRIVMKQEFSEFTYKVLYGRYVLFVLEK